MTTPIARPPRIDFYNAYDLYGELSNYFIGRIEMRYKGRDYRSAEHLYQSLKFLYVGASPATLAYAEKIRQVRTPNMAKILARQTVCAHSYAWRMALNTTIEHSLLAGVRPDPAWASVKRARMRMVIALKYWQCEEFSHALMMTGDALLAEHTARDSYWGDGGERRDGANVLSELLMAERAKHPTRVKRSVEAAPIADDTQEDGARPEKRAKPAGSDEDSKHLDVVYSVHAGIGCELEPQDQQVY